MESRTTKSIMDLLHFKCWHQIGLGSPEMSWCNNLVSLYALVVKTTKLGSTPITDSHQLLLRHEQQVSKLKQCSGAMPVWRLEGSRIAHRQGRPICALCDA